MRDDRAATAFERGMRRPLVPAIATIIVAAGVFLVGITLFVESTQKVRFPASVVVTTPSPPHVSVAVNSTDVVGDTSHASLVRGGQAGVTASPNADQGLPGFKRTTPKVTVKKTAKRPTSISGSSGPNGDAGFAGRGRKVTGEQSSTPRSSRSSRG